MSPRSRVAALLLTPGASAHRDHSQLVAIDQAVAPLGVAVERIDLPRTTAAPRLIRSVVNAADALAARAGLPAGRVVLGGRSMGGRMCSMAVSDGWPAAGLVLVSYPLHPPGRPDRARTAHLPSVHVPCLFVSGTKDAFAAPAELQGATAEIPETVSHVWLQGADHGLRRQDGPVAEAVSAWMAHLVAKF